MVGRSRVAGAAGIWQWPTLIWLSFVQEAVRCSAFACPAAIQKKPLCKPVCMGPAGRFPSESVAGPGTSYPALLSSTDSAPTHQEVQLFSLLENGDVYFKI